MYAKRADKHENRRLAFNPSSVSNLTLRPDIVQVSIKVVFSHRY